MLEQLIAGDLVAEESNVLEAHLTLCSNCRAQIDALSSVSTMEELTGGQEFSGELKSELSDEFVSPSLRSVMEKLLVESRFLNDPIHFAAGPTRDVLPTLQPTARPGFIGRLGDIEIRQVIGRGGMGVVFEGIDSILNRTVAVKVLSPHLVSDGEAKNRFLREARAAAALTHANVVSIHSINEADGMPYLVLKFVDGESLAQRLKRGGKLAFDEVIRVGIEVARGLSAAHQIGLIHRDIKPANIMIEKKTGIAQIADFGLAKLVDADSLTNLGSIAGTPAYMSPEQTTSEGLDGRSDLFSLGVVLYEASTGTSPFLADSPFVTLDNIRSQEPQSACNINAELPRWFGATLERLLAKNPENRFSSAQSLIDALESQSVVTPKIAWRGSRSWAALSTLAVTLLAAIVFSSFYYRKSDKRQESLAIAPTATTGFFVDQNSEPFESLADAIEAAQDKSVIEIHGNGPFSTDSIVIRGKRLTIRAAAESLPRFVPKLSDETSSAQFIHTDEDLRLQGLEIIWPIESTLTKFEDTGERCVVAVGGGNLNMSRCRVVAGRLGCCVGVKGSEITIKNCHLVSLSGTCLACPSTVSSITIEHCLLEGRSTIFTKSGQGASQNLVRFAFNTVVAERLMTLFTNNQNRTSVRFIASHNIFDTQMLFAINAFGGFQPNQSSKMAGTLRDAMIWQDESNLYRKGTLYLAGNPRNQPLNTLPSTLDSLDKWLAFWNQPASKSIEGEIQFEQRDPQSPNAILQLKEITTAGAIPPELGANATSIGPGSASK